MPPWWGPPEMALGSIVPVHRILARNDTVVIALGAVIAYPTGCTFDVHLAARRTNQTDEDWWDLNAAMFQEHRIGRRERQVQNGLPAEWFRCGVQFADGQKATNVAASPMDFEQPEPAMLGQPGWHQPKPPRLSEYGGGGGSSGDDNMSSHRSFWLWPLPPAETFDFVIEWPIAQIGLSRTQIDGAAVNAAAAHAEPYWPDWTTFTPPGVATAGHDEPEE
jgi:hypothetical protein